MSAVNRYKLNGVDMFTAYGFVQKEETSNPLLTPRRRKPVYSNNWAERNGAEWDLNAPVKYEDRQIALRGYIRADNEVDFHAKFNSLKSVFANTGYQILSCMELGSTYDLKCFYTDCREVSLLTKIKGGGNVYMEIELTLQEVQDA